MPGDPAGPTPPHTPNVVPLCPHRRAAASSRPAGDCGTPREPDAPAAPAETPEAILTQTIQALYLHRGRSLTDPDTAEAYDIALEAALVMVDAVFVQGHMGNDAHHRLRHMVTAARRVPDLL